MLIVWLILLVCVSNNIYISVVLKFVRTNASSIVLDF